MSKKIFPGILRFVSMLFKYLQKKYEQTNCSRCLQIRNYAFEIFEKRNMSKKIFPGVSEIRKYAFQYLKKRHEQKICSRYFEICKYTF